MSNRIQSLIQKFDSLGIEAALVTSKYNRMYLSGFTGSSCILLISPDCRCLLTDFRYLEQAKSQSPDFEIIDFTKKGLINTIKDLVQANRIGRIGFENKQMVVSQYEDYVGQITDCQWIALQDQIEKIRMIKEPGEIDLIRQASQIGDKAFSHILGVVKQGMTERELALELEFTMKRLGASNLSFDTIVVSGKRSSLPHGMPTDKPIAEGDFVTCDFGCVYKNYCSDMTRTFVMGKASDKQKQLYDTVLQAQQTALEQIKAGIKGKVGDSYARQVIKQAGYGDYFGHGLGHSLGLEVHENPRFSPLDENLIQAGMIMSVEPGIYIPDFGGVRIEDLVAITPDGVDNLVTSEKQLIEIS